MSRSSHQYKTLHDNSFEETEFDMSADKAQLVDDDGNAPEKEPEKEPINDSTYVREQICGFDGLKFIVASSVLFAIGITIAMIISILFGPSQIQPYGAVSTDAQECSLFGSEILQRGGSAVDAGIAAMLCLGVVHPFASGIGGGGFMIVGNPKDQTKEAFNFREMSPKATHPDAFSGLTEADIEGGMSVAAPGEIAGFRLAWEKHGVLPWRKLFEKAINLARNGFQVTEALEDVVSRTNFAVLPENLQSLLAPRGQKVNRSQKLVRSDYAITLEILSTMETPSLDYFAQEIIKIVNEKKGNLSKSDVVNYTAEALPIYTLKYGDQDVYATGAPSNGPMVLALMNIMKGYLYTTTNASDPLYYHRLVEATKFAEAYSTGLGDPDVSPKVGNYTLNMISNSTANKLHKKINDTSVLELKQYYPGQVHVPVSSYGGAQVLVMSSDGTMVSISSSINSLFGSKLMTPGGIILNDAMTNFDWKGKSNEEPSLANLLKPSKRPQSDLAPLLSWNISNFCTRRFALGGASGISDNIPGSRSSAGVAQVALRVLMGYNLTTAITPKLRVFDGLLPDKLEVEDGITNATIKLFNTIYGSYETDSSGLNIVHGLMKEKDQLFARADPRRLGAKAISFGRP